jgi:hypothetical protein
MPETGVGSVVCLAKRNVRLRSRHLGPMMPVKLAQVAARGAQRT